MKFTDKNIRNIIVVLFINLLIFNHSPANAENLNITHGPYLVEPGADCITIIWTTNKNCQSWVEYCGDKSLGVFPVWGGYPKKAYSSHYGLMDANSTHHSVRITGLKKGTKHRYRVVSKEIIQYNPYEVIFGDTTVGEILEFETLNPQISNFSFGVVSDLHERANILDTLLKLGPVDSLDMMFYAGDMLNWIGDKERIFNNLIDVSVDNFAKEKPIILARGNHEARGPNARELFSYFPHSSGKYYYAFTHGNVRFIILDPGEDKTDDHPVYGGLVDFDKYRTEQAEWLQKEVNSNEFSNAKYKIVISHIPLFSQSKAHGSTDITKKWGDILKSSNIDLIVSGHHHRYAKIEPATGKNNFPVLILGQDMILTTDVSEKSLQLLIKNKDQVIIDNFSISAK